MNVKTVSPGLAAVLAFIVPGLGHVYAGQLMTGLLIMLCLPCLSLLALVFLPVAVAETAQGNGNAYWLIVLSPGALWLLNVWHAYRCANV